MSPTRPVKVRKRRAGVAGALLVGTAISVIATAISLAGALLPACGQEQAAAVQKRPALAEPMNANGLVKLPPAPLPNPSALPGGPEPAAPIVAAPAPLAPGEGLPLRNLDLLNKMDDDRLPTSPRRFLKMRFKQVRKAKDEKILQLLLVCVGFVGVFVAILALRSVPPNRPAP